MAKELSVDRVSRDVIEGKLLATLDDKDKVAVVLSAAELNLLIEGLTLPALMPKHLEMLADLKRLRKEAFGV